MRRAAGLLLALGLVAAVGGSGVLVLRGRVYEVAGVSMRPTLRPGRYRYSSSMTPA